MQKVQNLSAIFCTPIDYPVCTPINYPVQVGRFGVSGGGGGAGSPYLPLPSLLP